LSLDLHLILYVYNILEGLDVQDYY